MLTEAFSILCKFFGFGGAATVKNYFVCVGLSLLKPYSKCVYDYKPKLISIKMIDYKTFTINTNIILLFNNVFSKLFYTISFINYILSVGPTKFLSMAHSMNTTVYECRWAAVSLIDLHRTHARKFNSSNFLLYPYNGRLCIVSMST